MMMMKAPQIKTGLRQFQDREGHHGRIKGKILKFAEKMPLETYREDSQSMPFFVFGFGSAAACKAIKKRDRELKYFNTKLDEHKGLTRLFECLDTIPKPMCCHYHVYEPAQASEESLGCHCNGGLLLRFLEGYQMGRHRH